MKTYKLTDMDWLIRLDVGDEIIKSLSSFSQDEGVKSASFTGIGAVGHLKYGYFDVEKKQYLPAEENISLEVLSLTGNIASVEGAPMVHAHIVVSFPDMSVKGGHLIEGTISVTGEIFLREYDIGIDRVGNERFRLNLID